MKKYLLIIATLFISGCFPSPEEIALRTAKIGAAQQMTATTYVTKNFEIFTLQRISDPKKPLRVYIEGDGRAYLNKYTPSFNPTPTSYFLVNLIAEDKYPNILYIARPCQYVDDKKCQGLEAQKYWTNARFSPEVVDSISEVLKNFSDYRLELIGYSGGGAIAKFIAAKNYNVMNFRTIAGNLDYQKFTEIHNVSPLDESIAPDQHILTLSRVPQIHFIGDKDDVIPKIIVQTYLDKLPQKNCVNIVTVENATHSEGWNQKWAKLLAIKPGCWQ